MACGPTFWLRATQAQSFGKGLGAGSTNFAVQNNSQAVAAMRCSISRGAI
jgi:hypothetical protein